jgi:pimeloyl-ACP methyl ester carboxylesterase
MGSILIDPDIPPDKSKKLLTLQNYWRLRRGFAAAASEVLGPVLGPPAGIAAVQQFRRRMQSFNMQVIWGSNHMIPWLFAHDEWKTRLLKGNGLRDPGSRPIQTGGLVNLAGVDPYSSFINRSQGQTDLMVFAYDWRLSNDAAAGALAAHVQRWSGGLPADIAPDEERITIIAHSMGGLVARHFIETTMNGYRLVKKLITVGTPHLGAPGAYANYRGSTLPLPFSLVIRPEHIVRVLFPAVPRALAARLPSLAVGPIMPPSMQIELIRSYASALQLLPTFGFLTGAGGIETPAASYAGMTHLPTGTSVVDIMALARGAMIGDGQFPAATPPHDLNAWLAKKDVRVNYHTLAGTGVSGTAQGYRKRNDQPAFAAKKMRAAGDVDNNAVRSVLCGERRVAVAPLDKFCQPIGGDLRTEKT